MSFFGRLWGYITTAFKGGVESRMDPSIQVEQALNEARKQDLELRNQAARVIAHRTEVQMKLDRAVEDAAKAKEQAAAALRNADAASRGGNAADVDKWTRAAQAVALRLQSAESTVESLKQQYTAATQQADLAKQQVQDNALQLERLSSKRLELVGKLQQAKMQEEVNKTLQSLNRPLETSAPSISEIEDKINRRMALASAQAELESSSLEGAQRDVERSVAQLEAEGRLQSLREELGLGAPPDETPAIEAAPAPALEEAPPAPVEKPTS